MLTLPPRQFLATLMMAILVAGNVLLYFGVERTLFTPQILGSTPRLSYEGALRSPSLLWIEKQVTVIPIVYLFVDTLRVRTTNETVLLKYGKVALIVTDLETEEIVISESYRVQDLFERNGTVVYGMTPEDEDVAAAQTSKSMTDPSVTTQLADSVGMRWLRLRIDDGLDLSPGRVEIQVVVYADPPIGVGIAGALIEPPTFRWPWPDNENVWFGTSKSSHLMFGPVTGEPGDHILPGIRSYYDTNRDPEA